MSATRISGTISPAERTKLDGIETGATDRLDDLLYGVTPTFTGWGTAPTDYADMTDHDDTTICTTGSANITGAYDYVYISWEFATDRNVSFSVVGGIGNTVVDTNYGKLGMKINGAWYTTEQYAYTDVDSGANPEVVAWPAIAGICEGVRICMTSDDVIAGGFGNVSPHIISAQAWRLS